MERIRTKTIAKRGKIRKDTRVHGERKEEEWCETRMQDKKKGRDKQAQKKARIVKEEVEINKRRKTNRREERKEEYEKVEKRRKAKQEEMPEEDEKWKEQENTSIK